MNRKNHLFFLYLLGSQDQNPVDAVSYFCGSNGFILKQTCNLRNNKIYQDIWSGSAMRNTYVTCDSHVSRTWVARESHVYHSGQALSDTYNISHDKEPLNSPIVTVFVLHVGQNNQCSF